MRINKLGGAQSDLGGGHHDKRSNKERRNNPTKEIREASDGNQRDRRVSGLKHGKMISHSTEHRHGLGDLAENQ